jgi:hypothetical protein
LVCMQYLCFLGFYELWSVQWLGHLLPPVYGLLQGFMCVCTQVSCSVVSNWSLCDFLWTCVLWYLVYIFNSSILFVFWDTRRWIRSKNTIRSFNLCYSFQRTVPRVTWWRNTYAYKSQISLGM